ARRASAGPPSRTAAAPVSDQLRWPGCCRAVRQAATRSARRGCAWPGDRSCKARCGARADASSASCLSLRGPDHLEQQVAGYLRELLGRAVVHDLGIDEPVALAPLGLMAGRLFDPGALDSPQRALVA